jgi:hypothetical protein
VEREYREIARMRQMMDVSIPMRAWCIGDGIPDSQGYSYILGEACYCPDGSSNYYISPSLYTALIPLCLQRCSACWSPSFGRLVRYASNRIRSWLLRASLARVRSRATTSTIYNRILFIIRQDGCNRSSCC